METIVNKQKIIEGFIPQPVIVFNNELLEKILDDFTKNEVISFTPQEKRDKDYSRKIEFTLNRGGIEHGIIVHYRYDFTLNKEEVNWVSINDIQIDCYVAEGRYEGDEVEAITPYWTTEDTIELEQSIIKYYNS